VFLRENFQREQRFADACRRLFGDSLFREIDSDRLVNFSSLERKEQQQLLMAFVPKLINSVIQPQGWRIGTETNLRYGTAPHAPMVTWIVRFTWDPMARATPDQVYRDSLATILAGAGVIRQDGAIASDLA
jgi:hypothetical protein